MSTGNLTTPPAAVPDDILYPASDGEPMAETGLHVLLMTTLIATLRHFFRRRPDVYVIGNIFLYYEKGNPDAKRAPDVMVVKGAQPRAEERTSYFLWEEGVAPSAVIELTSMKTAEEDVGPKLKLYERLGVGEYFLFDPLLHLLDVPLTGFRLVSGKYQPIQPEPDGSLISQELGLRLVPEGNDLALYDLKTGERIPAPPEAYHLLEETQRRADRERRRAEHELREKEAAQLRVAELERELARLKASKEAKPDRPGS